MRYVAAGSLRSADERALKSSSEVRESPGVWIVTSDVTRARVREAIGVMSDDAQQTEVREVRADDPALSPEVNQRLTSELREVVGTSSVRVPADRPHASRGEMAERRGALEFMNMHRLVLVLTFVATLTFGAVIALITNDWWLLILAAAVHATATMTVTLTVVRMTTITEHPSPELAAALTEQGVGSPDERFSRMVDEFRAGPQRGTTDVLSPGHNERTVQAGSDPAAAAAEQSSAMTPTADPSPSGGEGGAPDILIWSVAGALFLFSVVLPAFLGGGWMWLLPGVMVPLIAGWMTLQWLMIKRAEHMQMRGKAPLITIVVCTAAAVAIFCTVVAVAYTG